jgi:rare lipoprotein A
MQAFGLGLAILAGCGTIAPQEQAVAAASECGKASWYKMGHTTASGEKMNADALAGAHPTLPFGTKVRVQNLGNGKSVTIRINDRGPFTDGRIIDVTRAAAKRLGMIQAGVARVKVTVIDGDGRLSGGCA